jgi:hypothetical protein
VMDTVHSGSRIKARSVGDYLRRSCWHDWRAVERRAPHKMAACRCSGTRLCVSADEGRDGESLQYGPVALEVDFTIL